MKLKDIVGEDNFYKNRADLLAYSRDFSPYEIVPSCVVMPRNRDQVVEIVKLANKNKWGIIPRGAGTNTCGEVVGKGIVLDFTKMNRILEINEEDLYCRVEPGVVLDDLNRELQKKGLFFPPDPASSKVCTIGGMVGNNSSGLRAVKYGTTKDYVLALEVVLPDGKVIRTGSLAPKSSSGYDLTRLFVGSEGTLGIFTEITLRLLPIPEAKKSVLLKIDLSELDKIVKYVLDLRPSALEFMDEICLASLEKRYGLKLGCENVLIVEFQGDKESVDENIRRVKERFGGLDIEIWEYRKNLVPALKSYKRNLFPYPVTEDIGVPISKVSEAILKIKEIYAKQGLEAAVYGHCGDGNLHIRVMAENQNISADEVYDFVTSIEGTITTEHGIGLLRMKYMKKEHGNALDVMKDIKKAIDPLNVMNPGKMI